MSHRAVNWALEQTDLKPGPWIVLIKLADRHNKDTLVCKPTQHLLVRDCNMSRPTLNRHLAELEERGFLRRVARMNPETRRQLATQYILGCDFHCPPIVEFSVSQNDTREDGEQPENEGVSRVSNRDMEAVSQFVQKPCLKKDESRVSNRDTMNPVREPRKRTLTHARASADVREAGAGETSDPDLGFAQFWDAFPDPVERDAARKAFDAVLAAGEIDPPGLIAAAKAYAGSDQVQRGFGMKPANWLGRGAWRDQVPPATSGPVVMPQAGADLDAIARHWAPVVKAGRSFAASAIRPAVARHMMALDLVTADELRGVGVSL